MKKRIKFLMLLFLSTLLCTSCSGKSEKESGFKGVSVAENGVSTQPLKELEVIEDTENFGTVVENQEFNFETDCQNLFSWLSEEDCLETKESYYFLRDSRLFAFDKEAEDYRILCDNPICPHEYDESCGAYVSGIQAIEYYDNQIYAVYYQEGIDYEMSVKKIADENIEIFTPIDSGKYLRSADMLTEKDLSEGCLPQNMDEIVLYTTDKKMIGKTIKIYCYDMNMLENTNDENEYAYGLTTDNSNEIYGYERYTVAREFTVTGILNKAENQIYFDNEFFQMMGNVFSNVIYANEGFYRYLPEEYGRGIIQIDHEVREGNVQLKSGEGDENIDDYSIPVLKSEAEIPCIVVLNDDYEDDEVRISKELVEKNFSSINDRFGFFKIYNVLQLKYELPMGTPSLGVEGTIEDSLSVTGLTNTSEGKRINQYSFISFPAKTHLSGEYILETGRTLYDRIYGYDGSREVAVYTDSKESLDSIRIQMEQKGYQLYERKTRNEIYDIIYEYWFY